MKLRILLPAVMFALALTAPAHPAMTVLGNAKAAKDGFIPCIVSIDGSPRYRLEREVPAGTADADIEAWLNANVPPEAEAAWKAQATDPLFVEAEVPDSWSVASFGWGDLPPKTRAVLKVMLDEINALRAELGLPARTPAQGLAAVQAKLNE